MNHAGLIETPSLTSHYPCCRKMVRQINGDYYFVEVHFSSSLNPYSLYRKATAGHIVDSLDLAPPMNHCLALVRSVDMQKLSLAQHHLAMLSLLHIID
jgi:adenylylsulfate kinase-like enzyme